MSLLSARNRLLVLKTRPSLLLEDRTASQQRRWFARISSRTPARFRIPAHVAAFSFIFFPTVGLSLFYAARFGPSEEDLEASILERYQENVRDQGIAQKNQYVGEMFGEVFDSKSGAPPQEIQKRLDAVLRGGKSDRGRQRDLDEVAAQQLEQAAQRSAEAAAKAQAAEEEGGRVETSDGEADGKKRKRRKKKKRKKKKVATVSADQGKAPEGTDDSTKKGLSLVTPVVAVTGAAVVAAAAVGFLTSGRRS